MSSVTYHFVSSLRRGLTSAITASAAGARATLQMRVELEARTTGGSSVETRIVDREVQLYGPGDVLGFDPRWIVRTDPKPGVSDFEDNYFPFIELADPDFLWRFSAAAADGDGRLSPWLALVVLETDPKTAELRAGSAPPEQGLPQSVVVLKEGTLPDLEHAARWAHVQAVGAADLDVTASVTGSPEAVSCRLVCARRLRPNAGYAALVVPAFELGRCAGLGIDPADGTTAITPAWVNGAIPAGGLALPCYYRWDFRTGARGDFEYLVRLLQPRMEIAGLGLRDMDCAAAGFGLPAVDVSGAAAEREHLLAFEGALQPPDPRYTPWGRDGSPGPNAFRTQLADLILNLPKSDVRSRPYTIDTHDVPPAITGVSVVPQPNVTSVRVTWTSAEQRTSILEYGREGEDLRPRAGTTSLALTTAHSVLVSGLAPGVVYHFKIGGRTATDELVETQIGTIAVPSLPTVTPPIYGRWHAATQQVATNSDGWVDTLNLDPRHRGAAGFGSAVVREQQEPLMASAWEQLGHIDRANDLLRRGQLGRETSNLLWKRLSALGTDALLQATAPVHARVLPMQANGAIDKQPAAVQLTQSTRLPGAALSPAFRRISCPRGPLRRRQGQWTRQIVTELIQGKLQIVGPTPRPAGMGDLCGITDQVERIAATTKPATTPGTLPGTPDGVLNDDETEPGPGPGLPPPDPSRPPIEFCDTEIKCADLGIEVDRGVLGPLYSKSEGTAALKAVCEVLKTWLQFSPEQPDDPAVDPAFPEKLRDGIVRALHPRRTIARRVRSRLRLDDVAAQQDPLDPIMWAPEFPQPMYEPLRDLSQDLILPGIKLVPQNTVILVETNRRFLESYMVGLNHEIAAELLWRGYPTDQRGSCFQQFWDVRDRVPTAAEAALDEKQRAERYRDVAKLHTWATDSALGTHRPAHAAARDMVLLIRGDLLRRYPNTIVYAVPAVPKYWTDGARQEPKVPALEEYLEEGDPTALAGVLADNPKTYPIFKGQLAPDLAFFGFPFDRVTAEDRYFVLEEHLSEPRFGLDLPADEGPVQLVTWQDLAWDHFAAPAGASGWHLDDLAPIAPAGSPLDLDWWTDEGQPTSAQLAWATMQSPVRIAMRGTLLLPKRGP